MMRRLALAVIFVAVAARSQELSLLPKDKPSLEWSQSYLAIDVPADWRAYTGLVVDIENASTRVLNLQVEIRDSDSHDYWSRSNLAFALPPGPSKFRIPVEQHAGEAVRPGRLLDRARMKSVIFARDGEGENALLRIKGLRLVKEARARDQGIWAYDFGPEGSPVFPGFEAVGFRDLYTKAKGFGFEGAKFWQPYREACWVRGPDALRQDCLMLSAGTFRVDLPKGRYRVVMNVDHPGGYWGEFPVFSRRIVRAQGKTVLDEKGDAASTMDRFFRNEKVAPQTADEAYRELVDKRFHEFSFEVDVVDQGLRIDVENQGCPDRPCFGLALTDLVAYPVGIAKAGEAFQTRIRQERRKNFDELYRIDFATPAPAPVPAGLVVRAFRGERAVVELPLGSAASAATQSETTKFPFPVSFGWPVFRLVRDTADGSRVSLRERHVQWTSDGKRPVDATPSRVFIAVDVPADAAVGVYRGVVSVRPSSPAINVPFELRVVARTLPAADLPIGPFGHTVVGNWWPKLEESSRGRSLEALSLDTLAKAGFRQFSFEPRIAYTGEGAKAKVDTAEISRLMTLAHAKGFLALTGYGNVLRDQDSCRGGLNSKTWKRIFDVLEAKAKTERWLPLTLVLCDEPEGEDLKLMAERIARWPVRPKDARVHWSVTSHAEKGTSVWHSRLAAAQTLPMLADFELASLPKHWVYYNDLNRWSLGLRSFALRRGYGLQGRIAWTFNQNAADPFNPLDAREDDYHWCTATKNGELLCTTDWYREIAPAVRDYRSAQLLASLVAANGAAPEVVLEGKLLLEEIDRLAGERHVLGVDRLSDRLYDAISKFKP